MYVENTILKNYEVDLGISRNESQMAASVEIK